MLASKDNSPILLSVEVVEASLMLVFNLFFIVEFQKFFISLSVLPGRRAAICDHLNYLHKKTQVNNVVN